MVKTTAQIEEALSQEVSRGNFDAAIKETPDGFSYIEWHESNRIANRVFGFLGWSSQVVSCDFETINLEVMVNDLDEEGKPIYETNAYGKRVPRKHPEMRTFHGFKSIVRISVHAKDGDGTIVTSYHDGVGFGPVTQQGGSKNPMDTAAKAAKSDGLSTAFKHFGDVFGLFLYTKELSQGGSSYSGGQSNGGGQASGKDLGGRPSEKQNGVLLKSFRLSQAQIDEIPFKKWKPMIDDYFNKRGSVDELLTKYEIVKQTQPTQESNFPWQKAS